ncbi:MAG: type VI secretion system contractile sheath small subunit [Rhodobacteraceae bacterium]|nr:type VI secretion system contractile sheath small subunit [Paracoccaceae bacterium]
MSDSQKFIARNRAPRVQIEYDVELYGAEKKVQLPFVMGVMSDLSGKAEKPDVADRGFLEIDVDNFDDRMRAIAPQARFAVPNTLTGEGNLSVDLTFSSMNDFSPAAIAGKVDALKPLLEARQQLSDLMAYMDGKSGAEALIETVLQRPELMAALVGGSAQSGGDEDALATLAALAAQASADAASDAGKGDTTDETLAALAEREVSDHTAPTPDTEAILATVEAAADEPADQADDLGAALESLAQVDLPETEDAPQVDDILAGMDAPPKSEEPVDRTNEIIAGLEAADAPVPEASAESVLGAIPRTQQQSAETDRAQEDVLSGIERTSEAAPEKGAVDQILSGLEPAPDQEAPETVADGILEELSGLQTADADKVDTGASDAGFNEILSGISSVEETASSDGNDLDDVLAGLDAAVEPAEPDEDDLDDVLAGLESPESADPVSEPDLDAVLGGVEGPTDEATASDDLDDVLAGLDTVVEPAEPEEDDLDDVLAGLETPESANPVSEPDLDAVLGGVEGPADEAAASDDLDDVLAGLETPESADPESEPDLDAVLGGVEVPADEATAVDNLDDVLAGLDTAVKPVEPYEDDLDDVLAGLETPESSGSNPEADQDAVLDSVEQPAEEAGPTDDLDDILSGLEAPADVVEEEAVAAGPDNSSTEVDLDDLLGEFSAVEEPDTTAEIDDLDALLAGDDTSASDPEDDLDALLSDAGMSVDEAPAEDSEPSLQSPFGRITAERPNRENLSRPVFRMALLGDFSGRAAQGRIEIGDALANRPPIELDIDTVEDVIERFSTRLTLPFGAEGAGMEIPLGDLDACHPDELYESVDLFQAVDGLRQQLSVGSMAERTAETLKSWSETYALPIRLPKSSAATSVPANLKLSDFQSLIGDTSGRLTPAGPMDNLIEQIVGPHIVKAADAGAPEMKAALDDAMQNAMRLILHHPEFQALEAQWRSLDLMARRIETDSTLQIVLYDISAEELAADLAAQEDLSDSGVFRLVTDVLDPEDGSGGFSALLGLYTFEETPPHAELLARIAQVAAHVDAPFFAAITPGYLETAKKDRHPLVAQAWDTLRGLPEAAYVGLASPRFLLRLPYGAKSDPVDVFDFEEFNASEGLRSMLWANPIVLIAILLAATYKKDGKAMDLGSVMSLGNLPFHFFTDRHGDQVGLPCTERNLDSAAAQDTVNRGFMPVVWMKGRNEIRLGSFQSLAGGPVAGPWSSQGLPPTEDVSPAQSPDVEDVFEAALDPADAGADDVTDQDTSALDDLLSEFDDDPDIAPGDEDMDPELAALLEGL